MLRILIADDHEIVRRGIKQILQEGLSFLEIAKAENWDIIISDISMPGGGIMSALPKIKEQKPHQPVLIITIYPEEQYAVKLFRMGAAGYLNKDAATEELLKAVKIILS